MSDKANTRPIAIIAALCLAAVIGFALAGFAARQSRANGQLLKIVVAVSGCTVHDAPADCVQRQRDEAAAEGRLRTAEVDCLTRRAIAGLATTDPARTCQAQTPPNVYPGSTP